MKTTIYLIRHSERFPLDRIEKYNTQDTYVQKQEKLVLSPLGERKAEGLTKLKELKKLDKVYASHCTRTLETAKYILEDQNLKVTIDDRLDERRVGRDNSSIIKNWYQLQYKDENYKTVGGESQKEVRERFNEAFEEIIRENQGKRIAIFSHGYAITFFLMKWIKLKKVTKTRKLTFEYNGKIIFDKILSAPEIFKVVLKNNEIEEITNISYDFNE
jgi:broad specificity phosphatase PhoE